MSAFADDVIDGQIWAIVSQLRDENRKRKDTRR